MNKYIREITEKQAELIMLGEKEWINKKEFAVYVKNQCVQAFIQSGWIKLITIFIRNVKINWRRKRMTEMLKITSENYEQLK